MIERRKHSQLTWIDVMNPTAEEIRELVTECNIPLEYAHDLSSMTPRTEVHAQKLVLKATFDFPVVKRTDVTHPHEIKFIATKTHLITIHFEEIEALHRFQKDFEISSILKNAGKSATGGHLFMSLITELYYAMTLKLDYLESKMLDIEEDMFGSQEKEILIAISHINKRLVAFRQVLHTHENALLSLQDALTTAFGKKLEEGRLSLQKEYDRLQRRSDTLVDTLENLRDTNNAILTMRQNEIMKNFTILAFITFPLTLFTSMFGMNTHTTPILGNKGDFWVIVGIMLFVSVVFFGYFKYKKWI